MVSIARTCAFLSLLACILVVAITDGARAGTVGDDLSGFQSEMSKWVKTRELISREKSQWELERETLQASRRLLQQRRTALQNEIEELVEANTAEDAERAKLVLRQAALEQSQKTTEGRLRGMEETVLALAPRLPEPLAKRLRPLLTRIPNPLETRGPSREALGKRLMNILGVLAQAEKFNGTATLVAETRGVKGGQRVQVRTLYWGLAQAFYVAAHGDEAGIAKPGASGWSFASKKDIRRDTAMLLDIFSGKADALRFISLPVEIR